MLHSIYTAEKAGFDAAFARLRATYGRQIVLHLYKGYCTRHCIPAIGKHRGRENIGVASTLFTIVRCVNTRPHGELPIKWHRHMEEVPSRRIR